jgi:predicted NUDIX family phosphoesterase
VSRDEELVLGLPRSELQGGLGWRGVRRDGIDAQLASIGRATQFRRRGDVEGDPSWKQVIPYLVLRDRERWFLMRRSRAGGDARLFERWTIGVGGHINPGDGDLLGGLRREWREEVEADFEPEFHLVGLLNDDTDPVGAVHLGVVYSADAEGRPVGVRERDKLEGAFTHTDGVRAVYERLETWSQLVFDALAGRGRTSERAPGDVPAGAPRRS